MRGNKGLLLLVIALIAGGLMVFYFSYYGREREKQPAFREAEERETKAPREEPQPAPREKLEEVLEEKVVESQTMKVEDRCQKMETDLKEFFAYVDKQDYVRELEIGEDT